MKCDWCDEEVEAGEDFRDVIQVDAGGIQTRPRHRDCDVRAVVGSLGHQLGLCHCPGKPGVLDDPPDVSRRTAAGFAALYFWKRRNPGGRLLNSEKQGHGTGREEV